MNPLKAFRGLDYQTALELQLCPLEVYDGHLSLGCIETPDLRTQKHLRFLLRSNLRFIPMPETELAAKTESFYPEEEKQARKFMAGQGSDVEKDRIATYSLDRNAESPVVMLVNDFFSRAIQMGASDIHLEPTPSGIRVRYRLDGVLHNVSSVDEEHKAAVLSRVKVMAELDIAEKRRPQDGRILIDTRNKSVDVRVSTMPTRDGQKIVLRLLDKDRIPLDLKTLGLEGQNFEVFSEAIRRPHGLILVSGPTGSGKSTTLYAALKAIQTGQTNISTVEDPIEYQIPGINQTQMREQIGYTFAQAIRTFLRQDPDIIMVGEIRDPETAKYAIQAAQTGHLVLSTIHTNDAPSVVTRLLEMDMEPFLVASTVSLVLAQRLVRRVCPKCTSQRDLGAQERLWMGLSEGDASPKVASPAGCPSCSDTGYKGRIAAFEMMAVTSELQGRITEKAPSQKIAELAEAKGMVRLHQAGIELVKRGITSVEEVRRQIG